MCFNVIQWHCVTRFLVKNGRKFTRNSSPFTENGNKLQTKGSKMKKRILLQYCCLGFSGGFGESVQPPNKNYVCVNIVFNSTIF